MRKYLVILMVLVIGLLLFQGVIGWNQKQEMLADIILPGEEIQLNGDLIEFEIVPKVSNDAPMGYDISYILKPTKYQIKTVLGVTIPDYSKLSTVEIIVNIGFILGIIVCLMYMGLLSSVLELLVFAAVSVTYLMLLWVSINILKGSELFSVEWVLGLLSLLSLIGHPIITILEVKEEIRSGDIDEEEDYREN